MSKNFVKADHLLWVDLETTGLDENNDLVLEIGAVYTDLDLRELWSYGTVVAWPDEAVQTRLNDFARKMHTENGLLEDVSNVQAALAGPTLDAAVAQLVELLPESDVVALAGSGIAHLDRPFINVQMPGLANRLEYYNIDTGVLRRCLRIFGGDAYDIEDMPDSYDTDVKAHRALADVQAHLREALAYKAKLGSVAESAWMYNDLANS